jgi:hypothetical protein
MSNPIVLENANTGTTTWQYSNFARLPVQVYCDQTSYNPGDTINFFVSLQTANHHFTFKIFRLGYYGGTGGCLKYSSGSIAGLVQGYYDNSGGGLVNCPTAITDGTTHNIEAGWTSNCSYTIPSNACTGIYMAQFTETTGSFQTGCSFVVRGNTYSQFLAVRPYTTDAAYNDWGAHGLYTDVGVDVQTSLNKPMCDYGQGMGGVFLFELPLIHWMESQGYDLSYVSNIDVHVDPTRILTHRVYLSIGHDEYWTREIRDGVELARDSNAIGLAFLAANACYWQCRLNVDHAGNVNRTVTCYKVTTPLANLANDPFYGVDNTRVTSQWRDAVLSRPENALMGIMYSAFNTSGNGQWKTDSAMDTTYTGSTGLVANTSYGADEVGYEWDRKYTSPAGPSNLKIIGTSNVPGGSDTSNTTTYIASSGALVFAAGSVAWTWALDGWRQSGTPGYGGSTGMTQGTAVAEMQALLANIFSHLGDTAKVTIPTTNFPTFTRRDNTFATMTRRG